MGAVDGQLVDGAADGAKVGGELGATVNIHDGAKDGIVVDGVTDGEAEGVIDGEAEGVLVDAVAWTNCWIWNSLNKVAHRVNIMMKFKLIFAIFQKSMITKD